MVRPLNFVTSPDFTPLPYGLWSVVQDRSATGDRWQAGVFWRPLCGTAITTYDECITVTGTGGAPTPPPAKANTHTIGSRGAQPFTVVAQVSCSPVGYVNDPDEVTNARNAAAIALARTELIQVERAFWTGVVGGTANIAVPHLAANGSIVVEQFTLQTAATTVTGSTVLDVVEALGYLESRLDTCYGGVGVIHVPDILFEALVAQHLVVVDGPRLRTQRGHLIAVGAGYPGTGPDGTLTPNAVWMYATGAVFAYRAMTQGPGGELGPAIQWKNWLDRAENTMIVQAERTYLLGWDCCHFAVQVSLGGITTGQPLSAF